MGGRGEHIRPQRLSAGPTSSSPMWRRSSSPSAARRRIRPEIIPTVRRLVGGCAAACAAAACAAAGLEGRRTSHGGRVGLAVELTARGAATHAVQLAAAGRTPAMVVRYAASVATRDGADGGGQEARSDALCAARGQQPRRASREPRVSRPPCGQGSTRRAGAKRPALH